jgi:hypothetical protein
MCYQNLDTAYILCWSITFKPFSFRTSMFSRKHIVQEQLHIGFRHVTPVCTWSKTTDTTIETGTAYPSDYDATLGFEWFS